jgi:catechol 2,3-dioxygenase-like lactoylglutathione lyase family enzyme
MNQPIQTTAIHHITLTVSDVQRSQAFYEAVVGFQKIADYGPRAVMVKGSVMLVLGPPPDPSQATPGDRFNPNRVGLERFPGSCMASPSTSPVETGVLHSEAPYTRVKTAIDTMKRALPGLDLETVWTEHRVGRGAQAT